MWREMDLKKTLAVAIAIFAIFPALAVSASDAPPEFLSSYIRDGDFVPGDYGWLRWRFSTDAQDREKWARVLDWVKARKAELAGQIQSQLRASGVADPKPEPGCYGDEICQSLDDGAELAATFDGWESFLSAKQEAEPYFRAYDLAVRNAEDVVSVGESEPLGARLNALRIGDQLYLKATAIDPTRPPLPLSVPAVRVFRQLCWREARKRIRTDTAWLKSVVAKQGWPAKSAVGPEAAQMAWLIAQHSDDDPVFQLNVLRLMEPMLASGEASIKWYGYLYDRVWLKLGGKQRYGTQFVCVGGHFEPQPLEDTLKVDALRKDAGLQPLGDYAKTFPAHCENAGAK
jgi:hypothetical protein